MACVRHEETKKRIADGSTAVLTGIHVGKVMDGIFEEKMVNMFHVAYYVAKKERPFTDFPDLMALQERTGSRRSSSYRTDVAVAR